MAKTSKTAKLKKALKYRMVFESSEKDEFKLAMRAGELFSALWEIQGLCRDRRKYHSADGAELELAQKIEKICWQPGLIDDIE